MIGKLIAQNNILRFDVVTECRFDRFKYVIRKMSHELLKFRLIDHERLKWNEYVIKR